MQVELEDIPNLTPWNHRSFRDGGYVYIIRTKEMWACQETQRMWKIGISTTPVRRVKNLGGGWCRGLTLEIVATIKVSNPRAIEKALHKKYAKRRVMREWFTLDEFGDDEMKSVLESYAEPAPA